MELRELQDAVLKLKKETNTAILAHSYQAREIVEIADFTGDSYKLSVDATKTDAENILFCGVHFMAETAKMLSPQKRVFLANKEAGCPMAEQMDKEMIAALRQAEPDRTVVAYINTTASLKTVCDVCVTSSNAVKIVKGLPQKNIYFIPDQNLARFVAEQCPEKNVIPGYGFCHVHHYMEPADVEQMKKDHPGAQVLAHPECNAGIIALADYIGSTKGIINHAVESDCDEFIICTESGVEHELRTRAPEKKFYFAANQICPNMKKLTLEKVRDCLKNGQPVAEVTEEVRKAAMIPLERMLELGK